MDGLDDHLAEAVGGCLRNQLISVGLRAANQPSQRYQLGEGVRLGRESMEVWLTAVRCTVHGAKAKPSVVDRQTRVLRIEASAAKIAG